MSCKFCYNTSFATVATKTEKQKPKFKEKTQNSGKKTLDTQGNNSKLFRILQYEKDGQKKLGLNIIQIRLISDQS